MQDYRDGALSVFEIHLHLVWTTKYRKRLLAGEVGVRTRELIREICLGHEVAILKGHVAADHVHLFVSIPPQVRISRLVQWVKGKTSHKLMAEYAHLRKSLWGQHLWASILNPEFLIPNSVSVIRHEDMYNAPMKRLTEMVSCSG